MTQQWEHIWSGDVLDSSCKLRFSGSVPFHHVSVSCSMASLFKQILPKKGKVHIWDRLKSICFFFCTDFHWSEHHMVPSNSKRSWEICSYLEKSPWLLFVSGCLFWIFFFFLMFSHPILKEEKGREEEMKEEGEGRKEEREGRKEEREGRKE